MHAKSNLLNNALAPVLWTVFGFALFIIGWQIFLSIPEFDVSNLFKSNRALALFAYAFVILPLWGLGWVHILKKQTTPYAFQLLALSGRIEKLPSSFRWIFSMMFAVVPAYFLLYSPFRFDPFIGLFRFVIFSLTSLLISLFLAPKEKLAGFLKTALASLMLVSAIYVLGVHALTITSYPFSLTWSEGNRIWDYSVLFGADRYMVPENQELRAYIEFGRQFVWGLPFLFPQTTILVVRLWDTIVSVFPHLLLAVLLAFVIGRDHSMNRLEKAVFALWGLLFLSQGPIFPHLILPIVVMVLGMANRNTLISASMVAFASYYAAVSRFHWGFGLPVLVFLFSMLHSSPSKTPGWPSYRRPFVVGLAALAGTLTFLLIVNSTREFTEFTGRNLYVFAGFLFLAALVILLFFRNKSWNLPVVPRWVSVSLFAGLLVAGIYFVWLYVANSRSLQQDFLWHRWLPNSTFPPGILLALLLAVGPIILLLGIACWQKYWRLSKFQLAVVVAVLLSLFGAGMIASAKIGGGGDLHNLDLFLIAVLLIAAMGWPSVQKMLAEWSQRADRLIIVNLLLASPVLYISLFIVGNPLRLPPPHEVQLALETVQASIAEARLQGEILFMDQRQLLTFGFVENVVLVNDYEKKVLMDRALSANADYFENFYQDLADHRFSLIVSEVLFLRTNNPTNPFSEENDAWVVWVAEPLLSHYKPLVTFRSVGVQLLVPRNN